jgi:hypothetical protein
MRTSVPGSEHGLSSHILAIAFQQLPDLIHNAIQAVVTLKRLDNFNSEYMHGVSVKNLSSDPLVGYSLVIVLDRITNIVSAVSDGLYV